MSTELLTRTVQLGTHYAIQQNPRIQEIHHSMVSGQDGIWSDHCLLVVCASVRIGGYLGDPRN